MEYMDIETVKELDHVFGDIEELQKFRCLMMQYECAMLEVKTKLDVLNIKSCRSRTAETRSSR